MQSPNSRHCAAIEPDSSVRTTNGASSQRKNAAKKLQNSGLATVVVYHIRHRVLHHIDSTQHDIRCPAIHAVNGAMKAFDTVPIGGPDFATVELDYLVPKTGHGHGSLP